MIIYEYRFPYKHFIARPNYQKKKTKKLSFMRVTHSNQNHRKTIIIHPKTRAAYINIHLQA